MSKRRAWVYLTTNLINSKKYVGQTVTPLNGRKYVGSGKLIKAAIKKYGIENFKREDLFEGTEYQVDLKEAEYIREFNAVESYDFYNLKEGGHHGRHGEETKKLIGLKITGRKDSNETKKKKSNAHKGEKNAFYNKKHTKKSRSKIKESREKQVFPEGTNKKRSDTIKKTLQQTPREQCNVCKDWFEPRRLKQSHNERCGGNTYTIGQRKERSEVTKNLPKFQCTNCGVWYFKRNLIQYHNEKCKKGKTE